MTSLSILAAGAAGVPKHLNPIKLFLEADVVVQAVMAGLILASIWTWMIVVGFSLRIGRIERRSEAYERDFWKAEDFEAYQAERGKGDVPLSRLAAAGIDEWRKSKSAKSQRPRRRAPAHRRGHGQHPRRRGG